VKRTGHRASRPDLKLAISAAAGRRFIPFLRRHLKRAHALLAQRTDLRELSLALVGDRRMSALHQRFMGLSRPTDVLSFQLETGRGGRAREGEIIINVAQALRQARRRSRPPHYEVLLYAIHGMLHLSGYDDTTPRSFRAMHRMEDRLLTEMGLGKVFAG
jgi:probable rRNA maturation factor